MIKFIQVDKYYANAAGNVHALKNINLTIKPGEIFGVIGRSGAGKSTLLRCANLLERPTSGAIHIEDQDLTALSHSALRTARRQIGMIFQHFNLLSSGTVYQNIALPLILAGYSPQEIKQQVQSLLN